MKIIKTLFKTEIEIKPGELMDFWTLDRTWCIGLLQWLEKNFGFDFKKKESK